MAQNTYTHLLVTGGAGFIGSCFVKWVEKHHPDVSITVLDAFTSDSYRENLAHIKPHTRVVEGSILNAKLVESLSQDADAIVHFAAETHNDYSIDRPNPFFGTNVLGTFALLEIARSQNRRLHIVSTDEVFGDVPLDSAKHLTETSPYNPSSPYAATKAAADMLARAWARTYNVPITISNGSNTYGPAQHVEKFIPRQITNILRGDVPKLYGDGSQVRNWLYVEDHAEAIWRILTQGALSESYVVCSGEEVSNIDVLRTINKLMGRPQDEYEFVSDRPGHDARYALSAEKITKELGWKPTMPSLEEGLKKTIAWYTQNQAWWQVQKYDTETYYQIREKRLSH